MLLQSFPLVTIITIMRSTIPTPAIISDGNSAANINCQKICPHTTRMGNQEEKNMDKEMETVILCF